MAYKNPMVVQITYVKGRRLVAYVPIKGPQYPACTFKPVLPAVILDIDELGHVIGLEVFAFDPMTIASINEVLRDLGAPELSLDDMAPLLAAA